MSISYKKGFLANQILTLLARLHEQRVNIYNTINFFQFYKNVRPALGLEILTLRLRISQFLVGVSKPLCLSARYSCQYSTFFFNISSILAVKSPNDRQLSSSYLHMMHTKFYKYWLSGFRDELKFTLEQQTHGQQNIKRIILTLNKIIMENIKH